ncbi:MAG: hypothetical protein ACTHNX_10190, partial [Humibacter sp.]
FSNQTFYSGLIVRLTTPAGKDATSAIGDLTPLVGFVLAGLIYLILFRVFKPKVGGPLSEEPEVVVGVDAADDVA